MAPSNFLLPILLSSPSQKLYTTLHRCNPHEAAREKPLSLPYSKSLRQDVALPGRHGIDNLVATLENDFNIKNTPTLMYTL